MNQSQRMRTELLKRQARSGEGNWETRGWPVAAKIGWYTGPRGSDGCRDWTGPADTGGYPMLRIEGRMVHVSRLVLGLTPGDGRVAMHLCDRPICVEPAHLRVGTHAENAQDRERKGRGWQAKAARRAA